MLRFIIKEGSKKKKVLNWWWNSGLNLSEYLVDAACELGFVDLLEKWKKSNRRFFEYSEDAIERVSITGHIKVLDWWIKSNL